jgi:hypothetical protein
MKNLTTVFALFILAFSNLNAQKITDGATIDVNGLAVTFNINNKESVTIGGKNFDRYKVSATLVNNSGKSYNIRLNSAPQIASNTELVELNCINATGAKLTAKKLKLNLKPQNVNVTYWAYTKDGKYQSFVIPIIAGYYLDLGESITDEAIFIVPQGETPDVSVRKTM